MENRAAAAGAKPDPVREMKRLSTEQMMKAALGTRLAEVHLQNAQTWAGMALLWESGHRGGVKSAKNRDRT
jgi:hypothetical protein